MYYFNIYYFSVIFLSICDLELGNAINVTKLHDFLEHLLFLFLFLFKKKRRVKNKRDILNMFQSLYLSLWIDQVVLYQIW